MDKKDFFISYTSANKHQATWIAGVLEKASYTTIIQSWDFNAGENFIENMDIALRNSKRLIMVLSKDYLESINCRHEWTAAFTKYSQNEHRAIIPVKIDSVKPEGLLAPIVYIDLYNVDENKQEETLINGVKEKRNRIMPDTSGIIRNKRKGDLPLNNLPHSKNPYFTGRKDKLNSIYNNFKSGDVISLVQSINGLGGVGKTSIALEYSYTYSHEYDAIWWVNADTSTNALTSYKNFALKKNLITDEAKADDIIEAMKYWFNNNDDWLFIFDNADSDDFNDWLEPYMPQSRKGHVLITTRSSFFPKSKSVDIVVFNEYEAIEFLRKRTDKGGEGYSDDIAKLLAKRLQYLPLALEQAAAYIVETPEITYQNYIDLIEQYGINTFQKKSKNGKDFYLTDYSSIINATWNISIRKITNEGARQLFNICAYFAPDKIPVDMFIRGCDTLPECLQRGIVDDFERNNILRDLTRYSLLTCGQNNDAMTNEKRLLYMHRLLQEVVKKHFGENHEWIIRGLYLSHKLSHWNTYDASSIQTFKTDAAHIEKIAISIEANFPDDDEKLRAIADIFLNLFRMYTESFDIKTAINYSDKLILMQEKFYSNNATLKNRYNLFISYMNRAYVLTQVREFDKALKNINKSISLGAPLYIESDLFNESELASAYMNRGVIYEFINLYDKALDDKNKSLEIMECLYERGKLVDENSLAIAYMNRSVTYKSLQRYIESSDDNERSIKIWTKMKNEGKQISESDLAKAYLNKSINETKQFIEKNDSEIEEKAQDNLLRNIMAYNKKTNN